MSILCCIPAIYCQDPSLLSYTVTLFLFFLGDGNLYTVEEAVEKLGFGPFQVLVTFFTGFLWVRVVT